MPYCIAEVGLHYTTNTRSRDRYQATSSSMAYDILKPYFGMEIELREKVIALFMNQASHVIAVSEISSGGLTGTVADIRLILSLALQLNCNNLIIAHNHPSGNLTPSGADKELTRKLKEGAALMDIRLLDHLIVTAEHYLSLADEGLM